MHYILFFCNACYAMYDGAAQCCFELDHTPCLVSKYGELLKKLTWEEYSALDGFEIPK